MASCILQSPGNHCSRVFPNTCRKLATAQRQPQPCHPPRSLWNPHAYLVVATAGQRSRRTPAACHSIPDLHLLAFVPQVCFTQECQQEADREFLSVVVPGLTAVAGLFAYLFFRPPPKGDRFFQDPDTQMVFEAPENGAVGRDKKGALIYKVVSYTPYPCQEDVGGERLRIDVGPLQEMEPRTFVFEKILPSPSQLVQVSLPRPLGIVFEEDASNSRAVVAEFLQGSLAEREMKKAKLNKSLELSTAMQGDVLRAVTCTTLMYRPLSMFGAAKPTPNISLYSADGQPWPAVVAALKRGAVMDGPVTLVLERRLLWESDS